MTSRQGKSLLGTYAVLLASQESLAIVSAEDIKNQLKKSNFVILDELNHFPKLYDPGRNKSKGEKKRQRSEWNRNSYNSRKGLQRG